MSICQVKIICQNVLTVNRFTAILVPDKSGKVSDKLTNFLIKNLTFKINMKEKLILLAIVVVGVLIASFVAGKLGLNTYEEYNP